MTTFKDVLERLDLSQYYEAFVNEGFDSWDTLMDITESDLEALGVRLGHRRRLQRAILNDSKNRVPLAIHGRPGSAQDHRKPEGQRQQQAQQPQAPQQEQAQEKQQQQQQQEKPGPNQGGEQPRSKRKYRRHPKPDEFAPERPPSAYVIFSNQIRDKLKGRELSFTEIAKLVGERWQELESREKEPCEREAQALKDKYYTELKEYKKTSQYQQYQKYLADFKAKHSDPSQDNTKKPKLQHENSQSQISRSNRDQSPAGSPSVNESNADALSVAGYPRQGTDSPSGSPQNSPTESSPTTDHFRRFPAPQTNCDDGTASSYSAWRPGLPLTLFQRHNPAAATYLFTPSEDSSRSPLAAQNAPTFRPAHTQTPSLPSLTRVDTVSTTASSNPSLLNWPLHTTLPPIDPKGNCRTLSKDLPLSLGSTSRQLPAPPPTSLLSPDVSSRTLDVTSKKSLSTLLRATEHVERKPDNSSSTFKRPS